MKRLSVVAAIFLAGCIRTAEMPLAPNAVRLDTQASGLLFTGQATGQTMRRAAELTLQGGYTHFKLQDAQMAQGSEVSGVIGNSTTALNGAYRPGGYTGVANSFGSASVVRRPTANVGVTVVMFHSNEPGAHGAFDAQMVLKQHGG